MCTYTNQMEYTDGFEMKIFIFEEEFLIIQITLKAPELLHLLEE